MDLSADILCDGSCWSHSKGRNQCMTSNSICWGTPFHSLTIHDMGFNFINAVIFFIIRKCLPISGQEYFTINTMTKNKISDSYRFWHQLHMFVHICIYTYIRNSSFIFSVSISFSHAVYNRHYFLSNSEYTALCSNFKEYYPCKDTHSTRHRVKCHNFLAMEFFCL